METQNSALQVSVYYDGQFWVGLVEKTENGKLYVAKYVFGAEPKGGEVLETIKQHYDSLTFSPAVDLDKGILTSKNPKVLKRKIKKSVENVGVGTKSQQAIKLQVEQRKVERKANNKIGNEQDQKAKYELKKQKKKEKKKGR